MQLFPSSFTTRAKVATILATVAVTLVVVLAALNLMTGEKPIKRHLEHQYAIADPQFQRTLGVLLGPVILPDNRFEVLLNGDQIFPAMLGAIRRAQRTITFETYIYWSGRIGDAFVNVSPDADLVERFEGAGGNGKPKYGQITACWAASKEEAKQTAWEHWPNAATEGAASQELPLPEHFEQLAEGSGPDDLEEALVLGPDPEEYLQEIEQFADAGFTHVYLHQIGPDQAGFLDFARKSILTRL